MTDNIEYKKLELMLNLGRDEMVERLLHYKEQDLESVSDTSYLIEEIMNNIVNGRPSLDELTDKEIAEQLVDWIEREEPNYFEENGL